MKKKIDWGKGIDIYLIEKYGLLPLEEIVKYLKEKFPEFPNINSKTLRCRASFLRKKGYPIRRYTINWQDPEMKTKLQTQFGAKPTHLIAEGFNKTISAIYRAVKSLGIIYEGNKGRYTFDELGKILKKDPDILRRWKKHGLNISSSYTKDGLTYSLMKRNLKKEVIPKYSRALISLYSLKRFLKKRPEAYDLNRLDDTTKHLLELKHLKISWHEKEACCKNCNFHFWTALYNETPRCPKCGRIASKWSQDYK